MSWSYWAVGGQDWNIELPTESEWGEEISSISKDIDNLDEDSIAAGDHEEISSKVGELENLININDLHKYIDSTEEFIATASEALVRVREMIKYLQSKVEDLEMSPSQAGKTDITNLRFLVDEMLDVVEDTGFDFGVKGKDIPIIAQGYIKDICQGKLANKNFDVKARYDGPAFIYEQPVNESLLSLHLASGVWMIRGNNLPKINIYRDNITLFTYHGGSHVKIQRKEIDTYFKDIFSPTKEELDFFYMCRPECPQILHIFNDI